MLADYDEYYSSTSNMTQRSYPISQYHSTASSITGSPRSSIETLSHSHSQLSHFALNSPIDSALHHKMVEQNYYATSPPLIQQTMHQSMLPKMHQRSPSQPSPPSYHSSPPLHNHTINRALQHHSPPPHAQHLNQPIQQSILPLLPSYPLNQTVAQPAANQQRKAPAPGSLKVGQRVRMRDRTVLHASLSKYSNTLATICSIPIHPTTWYGLVLQDGKEVKLRSSSFEVVNQAEGEIDRVGGDRKVDRNVDRLVDRSGERLTDRIVDRLIGREKPVDCPDKHKKQKVKQSNDRQTEHPNQSPNDRTNDRNMHQSIDQITQYAALQAQFAQMQQQVALMAALQQPINQQHNLSPLPPIVATGPVNQPVNQPVIPALKVETEENHDELMPINTVNAANMQTINQPNDHLLNQSINQSLYLVLPALVRQITVSMFGMGVSTTIANATAFLQAAQAAAESISPALNQPGTQPVNQTDEQRALLANPYFLEFVHQLIDCSRFMPGLLESNNRSPNLPINQLLALWSAQQMALAKSTNTSSSQSNNPAKQPKRSASTMPLSTNPSMNQPPSQSMGDPTHDPRFLLWLQQQFQLQSNNQPNDQNHKQSVQSYLGDVDGSSYTSELSHNPSVKSSNNHSREASPVKTKKKSKKHKSSSSQSKSSKKDKEKEKSHKSSNHSKSSKHSNKQSSKHSKADSSDSEVSIKKESSKSSSKQSDNPPKPIKDDRSVDDSDQSTNQSVIQPIQPLVRTKSLTINVDDDQPNTQTINPTITPAIEAKSSPPIISAVNPSLSLSGSPLSESISQSLNQSSTAEFSSILTPFALRPHQLNNNQTTNHAFNQCDSPMNAFLAPFSLMSSPNNQSISQSLSAFTPSHSFTLSINQSINTSTAPWLTIPSTQCSPRNASANQSTNPANNPPITFGGLSSSTLNSPSAFRMVMPQSSLNRSIGQSLNQSMFSFAQTPRFEPITPTFQSGLHSATQSTNQKLIGVKRDRMTADLDSQD